MTRASQRLGALLLVVGVVLLGTVGGMAMAYLRSASAPALYVESNACVLGDVFTRGTIETVFQLENMGRKVLHLDVRNRSCSCTQVTLSAQEVLPRQTAQLTIRLVTPHRQGPFKALVTLGTNDPKRKVQEFSLEANVWDLALVHPKTVNFSDVDSVLLPSSRHVLVVPGEHFALNTLGDMTIINPISSLSVNSLRDERGWQLDVQLNKDAPLGILNEQFFIRFGADDSYSIAVPVLARVKGRCQSIPDTVFFSDVEPGIESVGLCAIVGVEPSDTIEWALEDAELSDILHVSAQEVQENPQLVVRLVLPEGKSTLSTMLNVRIVSTENGDEQSLRIPIIASRKRARRPLSR